MSPKRLFRLSQITFNKINALHKPLSKLSKSLKHDAWWNNLSATEHQKIGKFLAHHKSYFQRNCCIPVKISYLHTDCHGNGIYG